MSSADQKIRDDEQYYYDTLTRKNTKPKNAFNWVPLLLIPLFFVLGWVMKGAYSIPDNSVNNPQYGIGGGPGNVTPYTTNNPVVTAAPLAQPVTATIEPSLSPDLDSEVQDTPRASVKTDKE